MRPSTARRSSRCASKSATRSDPGGNDTRRFEPAGALLGAVEVGQVEAFVHESLGSEGGPSSLFLGYLAYGDSRTGFLYRAGLSSCR